MSIVGQNIRKLREAVGETQSAFAAHFGLNRGQIASYEAEEKASEPSLATVMAIVDNFDIDIRSFVSDPTFDPYTRNKGTRAATKTPETANLSANPSANLSPASKTKRTNFEVKEEDTAIYHTSPRILVITTDNDNNDNISFVSTRVAAGYAKGGFVEREFMRKLPTFSLPDSAYRNGTFRAFQVSGESMQPTLYEGDWVICRYVDNWDHIRDTFVHVVVTEEIPVVKRLLNRLTERGQLSLQSDNPAFPTQFMDGADVREVWVAVGRLSRQFANPRYDLVQEVSRTRSDVDELMAQFQAMQQQMGLKLV